MAGCREDGHTAALTKKAFALTWWQAVGVLLDRQWKLTVRDGALVRGRIIQVRSRRNSAFAGHSASISEQRPLAGLGTMEKKAVPAVGAPS